MISFGIFIVLFSRQSKDDDPDVIGTVNTEAVGDEGADKAVSDHTPEISDELDFTEEDKLIIQISDSLQKQRIHADELIVQLISDDVTNSANITTSNFG
jgi:hypothetical protein